MKSVFPINLWHVSWFGGYLATTVESITVLRETKCHFVVDRGEGKTEFIYKFSESEFVFATKVEALRQAILLSKKLVEREESDLEKATAHHVRLRLELNVLESAPVNPEGITGEHLDAMVASAKEPVN